jgi:hypothetical protein
MNAFTERACRRLFRIAPGALPSIGALTLMALYGCAAPVPPTPNASLPAMLQPAPDEVLQEVVTTRDGDETYICHRTPKPPAGMPIAPVPGISADGTQLLWTEVGPAAMLVDAEGDSIGTVAPADHFLAYDGSYVVGKTFAESPVKRNALTWARYTVKFVATPRPGDGRFANVSSIQRIDTTGGLPTDPSCKQEGEHLFVPFTATYKIYRVKGNV